ncbi:MAG: hypothetical protein IJZ22_04515 [Bacteroidaceae bacterium]|nr:hypothetical protein [Bacteroidaceae bacterium]
MTMRISAVIVTLILLAACSSPVPHAQPELIAHAGGEVDGFVYTNSREALEQSVAAGYRNIEFDLLFTADSILVAAHSWQEFNEATGFAHKGDTAPQYADFATRRIHGRYTPLSAAEINDFFMADTTLLLVTDKISSPAVLAANFPTLKERMMVEAFNYNDYSILLSQGYYRVLYSCLATDLTAALVRHLLLHPLFKGPKIEWITMYAGELDNPTFRIIDALASFKMALFTINDYARMPQEKFRDINKVKMIYTDKLKP